MTIDNKTQATVSGSGKSNMSYRVAVVDSLGTSETVAAMKTGDSSGTTEYAALTNSDSTYQAVVSGTYNYNTTYYAVFWEIHSHLAKIIIYKFMYIATLLTLTQITMPIHRFLRLM